MKNEGLMLVAFIILAVTLLILVVRSEREHFGKYSANTTLALSQLEDDVNILNERLTTAEGKISTQEKEMSKAQENVDNAAVDMQIATAR
jgi:uncharacterized protein YlxW (UPF0749 family)